MNVVLIRTNAVNPDPRVEKEVRSILKNKSINVTILAWDRDTNVDSIDYLEFGDRKARIIRFGIPSVWGGGMKKNFFPLLKFFRRVKKWLKKNKKDFDCIHACNLPAGLSAIKYRNKKKIIYDIYDFFSDTSQGPSLILKYARKKEISIINKADVTIICSEQRIQQICGSAPKKLCVIHNSPNRELVSHNSQPIIQGKSSRIKFVYVGNLIDERFITQICEIVSSDQEMELHIGGIGVLSDYVDSMSKKNNNIFYYGKLSYDKVISLESGCDVMFALYNPLIKNNTYAAPNKFYEGLLLGKPLIMIKNTGMDSVVEKEGIGVVVEPSKEGIYRGMKEICLRKSEWPFIKEKMTRLYDECYSWDIMEKRLLEIYGDLNK